MSELRQNLATNQWTVIAEARSKKPTSFSKKHDNAWTEAPDHDAHCPFCPGNEDASAKTHFEIKKNGHWQVRVIANKYGALGLIPEKPGVLGRVKEGPYQKMGGFGHHDVFIESPVHNQTTGTLSTEGVSLIVQAYHRRFNEVENEKEVLFTSIFRNFGPLAGSSMRHPHSQLASTTVVPLKIRTHLSEAQNYFDREGRCAYCDMLAYELEAGKRVIFENRAFVAFIPFAAGKAYEVWLIPKTHRASFGRIPEGDIPFFADALRVVSERYYLNLDKTAYNYVLRSAPYGFAESRSYHWYIRFVPHFKDVGAFELGSGIQVSAVSPENAAQVLARTTN